MLGDEIAQRVVEGKSQPDRARTAGFAVFGLAWCGFAQYGVYSKMLPWVRQFVRRKGWWDATWRTELVSEKHARGDGQNLVLVGVALTSF